MQNVEVPGDTPPHTPSPWGPPSSPRPTGVQHPGGVAPADDPWRCDQANSSRAQEDLEGEFQSLYALLDELKDEMLMKIKQDRASRTYELQVSTHPACPLHPPTHRHPRPPLPLFPPHPRPSWRRVPRRWRARRSCWRRPTRPWGRPTIMTSPRFVPTSTGGCPHPAAPHAGVVLTPPLPPCQPVDATPGLR